jgi:hypothetical protein
LEQVLLWDAEEVAMKTRMISWALALVIGAACAGTQPRVKPDDMSAAEHRETARHERELAQQHVDLYDPAAARTSALAPPAALESGVVFPSSVYNPTEGHLREADKHREHAREHERAASALEHFEEGACREFPERTRAACPLLGPVTKIEDVPRGVRVSFSPGTRVDAVVEHMRCHYAYARSHAFDARVNCPLYMPGIAIRRAGELAVEILAGDDAHIVELRTRSREEAVYSKQGQK